jgi:toluene monooxygenase electron transfer component
MPWITITPDVAVFNCDNEDTILRAALRAGLGISYSCNVGSCGNCRFELLEGEVEHLRADAPAWTARDIKRNRFLGCQARPLGDCRIKVRTDPGAVSQHRPVRFRAVLSSVRPLTRDISEFAFELPTPRPFRPGQYALITVPGVDGARAYSMAGQPDDGTWRFLIKHMPGGAATTALFNTLKLGDSVTLDGPYGTAWLREDNPRDLLLLAGGSGLSPMLSIARAAAGLGLLDNRKLHFFYGGKSSADLFDRNAELGRDISERIEFTEALSEADKDWHGAHGFVHKVATEHLGGKIAECEIYFAGPAVMSAAVQEMARGFGVPQERVHFDEFY